MGSVASTFYFNLTVRTCVVPVCDEKKLSRFISYKRVRERLILKARNNQIDTNLFSAFLSANMDLC